MKPTGFSSAFRSGRGHAARLVALGLLGLVASAVPAAAAAPVAAVVGLERTRVADLGILNSGFNAGLRQGMVCRLTRGAAEIGEILLVELRPTCSAALILSVAPRQSIRPGDLAAIKVLKS